jgi:hypothetical protein
VSQSDRLGGAAPPLTSPRSRRWVYSLASFRSSPTNSPSRALASNASAESRCAGQCRRSSRRNAAHHDVVSTCTADRSGRDSSPGAETSGLSRSAGVEGRGAHAPRPAPRGQADLSPTGPQRPQGEKEAHSALRVGARGASFKEVEHASHTQLAIHTPPHPGCHGSADTPCRYQQAQVPPVGSGIPPSATSSAERMRSAVRWMRVPAALIAAIALSPPPDHLAVIYSLGRASNQKGRSVAKRKLPEPAYDQSLAWCSRLGAKATPRRTCPCLAMSSGSGNGVSLVT